MKATVEFYRYVYGMNPATYEERIRLLEERIRLLEDELKRYRQHVYIVMRLRYGDNELELAGAFGSERAAQAFIYDAPLASHRYSIVELELHL